MENKQDICNLLCSTLRATNNAGNPINNPLKELIYSKDDNGYEWVTPIFEDGTGTPTSKFPHGYYAVNVTCDSGTAMISDIVKHFVNTVW